MADIFLASTLGLRSRSNGARVQLFKASVEYRVILFTKASSSHTIKLNDTPSLTKKQSEENAQHPCTTRAHSIKELAVQKVDTPTFFKLKDEET